MREGDITPATFQKDEVPLQANCIDENLDINMEELNEPIEVIYETIKIILGDHTYYLQNNSSPCYVCQDKSNLLKVLFSKLNKLTLENKQLKHGSVIETSTFK